MSPSGTIKTLALAGRAANKHVKIAASRPNLSRAAQLQGIAQVAPGGKGAASA